MLVAEALNTDTRVLCRNDSIEGALHQMDEMKVSRLPVLDHSTNKLVGQVDRLALERAKEEYGLVSELTLEKPIAIFNNQHLFHAVRLMLQHELVILPVVDENWIFEGVIEKHQMLKSLGYMLNLTEYGSVITIELNQRDFTISKIVQLIETEGGSILGITVEPPNEQKKAYEVSIKLNLQDVSRIASSLRRHGYTILTEDKSESANIDLETRADEFLKYLDI